MKKTERLLFLTLFFISSILFIPSCASLKHNHDILVLVDGAPVTKGDLEYSLNIAHRLEDLSSAKDLDMDKFIRKLIDERLIIGEARRMGLEEHPDIQRKVSAFVLSESVTRLYSEEIEQKISVTEDDIIDYYHNNYVVFYVGFIGTESEETALKIMELIERGEDFKDTGEKYASYTSQEVDLIRMHSYMKEAVGEMTPGEISGIKKAGSSFYIFKLFKKDDAPDEGLEARRNGIISAIRDIRDRELSKKYLDELRSDADVTINEDLLASLDLNDRESLKLDDRILVESDTISLTIGEFTAVLKPGHGINKEKALKSWIDNELVDQEALSRRYHEGELGDSVDRYRNQLLEDAFYRIALIPNITVSEEDLRQYYNEHSDDYLKPFKYKIQQITVKTEGEAGEILRNLEGGASFSWLAKTRSTDLQANKGGILGWKSKRGLQDGVAEIIDTLKPGEISPIINIGESFRIIKLIKKSDKEVKAFESVGAVIHKLIFRERFNELKGKYTEELRGRADITVFEENVKSVTDVFKR